MTDDHGRVTELFHAASEIAPEERERWLRSREDDGTIVDQVLALLAFDDPDEPSLPSPLDLAPAERPASEPRRTIGPYELLDVLGRGGMGVVYRARQSSPAREVALKIVRPGASLDQLGPRLEREAAVLARLTHPGIARVYDSGIAESDDGPVPYFAMELVEGRTIVEHADAERLDADSRLALLGRVCDAVHHAHERGVIHRDLKAANVLIDSHGVPRVLDFGVAAVADMGAETRLTLEGTLLGTLASMAPELARRGADLVDRRADVYGLGALGYELLGHRAPLALDGLSLTEAVRSIERDEPTPLGRVDRRLAGDVETVIAKALSKDPARRYASAEALRRDLEHLQQREPIEARPASALYRSHCFLRRHATLTVATTLIMASLVAATVASVRLARQERDARDTEALLRADAEQALARSREVALLLTTAIESANPFHGDWQGGAATVLDLLESLVERVDAAPPSDPTVEVETRLTIARSYKGLGRYDEMLVQLERASARAGEIDDDVMARGVVRETAIALGRGGDAARAVEILDALLVVTPEGAPDRVYVLGDLAWALSHTDELERAREVGERALELAAAREPVDQELVRHTSVNLAKAAKALGDREFARDVYRDAYERARVTLPYAHPTSSTLANNLGFLLHELGDTERAIELLRESVDRFRACHPGPHPLRADFENNLAIALASAGRTAEALEAVTWAAEDRLETLGPSHRDTANATFGRTMMLEKLERWEDASAVQSAYAAELEAVGDTLAALAARVESAICLARDAARRNEALARLESLLEANEGNEAAEKRIEAAIEAILDG